MKKIGLLILYLITSSIAIAYENADKWETHLSYSNTNRVCVTENKVFAIASNHLYSISKEDKLLEIHTKLDGFSEMRFCDPANTVGSHTQIRDAVLGGLFFLAGAVCPGNRSFNFLALASCQLALGLCLLNCFVLCVGLALFLFREQC